MPGANNNQIAAAFTVLRRITHHLHTAAGTSNNTIGLVEPQNWAVWQAAVEGSSGALHILPSALHILPSALHILPCHFHSTGQSQYLIVAAAPSITPYDHQLLFYPGLLPCTDKSELQKAI